MFPEATDIMELSVDEMEEWTEVLCELIGRHSFLTYPTEWLAMESADYWINQRVPEYRKGVPPVTRGHPEPASVHTSQRAWITKHVAEKPPAAATAGSRCDHQMAANMAHQLAIG